MDPVPDPLADLRLVQERTSALLRTVEGMDRADRAAPSLLPGWTRAHVVAHLTSNADALVNLLLWAKTGVRTPLYRTAEERTAGIESGVDASAEQAAVDLRAAAERLRGAASAMADDEWDVRVRMGVAGAGAEIAARELPWRRLEELEVHHVDLDVGYTPAHWTPEFAERMLDMVLRAMATSAEQPRAVLRSTDTGGEWALHGGGAPVVSGPTTALLAWVLGRSDGSGLVVDGADAVPTLGRWR